MLRCLGLGKIQVKMADFSQTQLEAVRSAEGRRGYMCIQRPAFQGICATAILLNAIYIAINSQKELELWQEGKGVPVSFLIADILFSAWFLAEIGIRCIVEPWLWCFGPEWRWNLLDTMLVVFSIVDVILSMQAGSESSGSDMASARILRLARLVRLVRLVHAVRIFHSLRIVVLGLIESIKSMYWVFMVVAFIIYMFAVFFLNGVVEYVLKQGKGDPNSDRLISLFGSIVSGMTTLFMAITGGIDWHDISIQLRLMSWLYEAAFMLYIFIMYFAVLNVVIGAVVAATADISNKDKDLLVKSELIRFERSAKKLRLFFEEADVDGSGVLSWAEFESHLESNKVKAHFQALELEVSQARELFQILDTDGSETVGLEEFVSGCMRLKNPAKSLDIRLLMCQNENAFTKLKKSMDSATRAIFILEDRLSAISARVPAKFISAQDCAWRSEAEAAHLVPAWEREPTKVLTL